MRSRKSGQSLPEYTLILAIIAFGCMLALTNLGETVMDFLMQFASMFTSAMRGG